MAKARCFGLMEHDMKESGLKDSLTAREYSIILMEIYMMVHGKTTNVMDSVYTPTTRVQDIRATGKMTLNRAKESKLGLKDLDTKARMRLVRNKAMELTPGMMEASIPVIGLTIEFVDLVSINGKMEENIMVTG